MNKMLKLKQQLNHIFKIFVFIMMFGMVLMIFGNAVARYAFHSGLPISEELSRFAFVWVSFLGAIVAYNENQHVGVTLLVDKLTGVKKLIIMLISDLIVILALVIIGVGGVLYFNLTSALKSPASDLPMGIITITALVTAVAMIVRTIILMKEHIEQYKKEGKKGTVL